MDGHDATKEEILSLPAMLRNVPHKPPETKIGQLKGGFTKLRNKIILALRGEGGPVMLPAFCKRSSKPSLESVNEHQVSEESSNGIDGVTAASRSLAGLPFMRVLELQLKDQLPEGFFSVTRSPKDVLENIPGLFDAYAGTGLAVDSPWMRAYLDWQYLAYIRPEEKVEWLPRRGGGSGSEGSKKRKLELPDTHDQLDLGGDEANDQDGDTSDGDDEATPTPTIENQSVIATSVTATPDGFLAPVARMASTPTPPSKRQRLSDHRSPATASNMTDANTSDATPDANPPDTGRLMTISSLLAGSDTNYLPGTRYFLPPLKITTPDGDMDTAETEITLNMTILRDLCGKDLPNYHPSELERWAGLAKAYQQRRVTTSFFERHQPEFRSLPMYAKTLSAAADDARETAIGDQWANEPICAFKEYPTACQEYIARYLGADQLSEPQKRAISDHIKQIPVGGSLDLQSLPRLDFAATPALGKQDLVDLLEVLRENISSKRYENTTVDVAKVFKAYDLALPGKQYALLHKLVAGLVVHHTTAAGGKQLTYRHCNWSLKLAEAVLDEAVKLAMAVEWAAGNLGRIVEEAEEAEAYEEDEDERDEER
ncbi:hypothetical protein KVT40_008771 [Elsinoe batatas]|uniref:Uncharacterized protein n=1 Tax=Elsinoe batatas TaxID=2601811 RepID=A0A8K0KV10_9PEZI|nr:hypothetical protein KVT40_008771 [Elsinoe batatas]